MVNVTSFNCRAKQEVLLHRITVIIVFTGNFITISFVCAPYAGSWPFSPWTFPSCYRKDSFCNARNSNR